MHDRLLLFKGRHPFVADFLALLAGAIAPLALAPFGLWPLTFVSFIVFIWLIADASVVRGSIRFYLYGIGMYGVGASWIYVSVHEHGNASALLAGVLVLLLVLSWSLLSLLHGYLYMRFVRPLAGGLVPGFALAWYLREWVLTWLLTGFPWLYVGYGFLDTPFAGFIPVLGVTGVGLLVTLLASLFVWALRVGGRRSVTIVLASVAVTVLAGAGLRQLAWVEPTGDVITVSAVQGNIDQRVKWQRSMVSPILETYIGLTEAEWGRDLILWPEAAITLFRQQAGPLLDQLDEKGKEAGSALVLGIPDSSEAGGFLNTAIALGDGEGRYIKRRLVPFGEYVPLEGLLRGVIGILEMPMARNEPGPWEQQPITVRGHAVSLSICYEVIYPEIVRQTTASPDLLITISNDAWFGDSIGPLQHLQMAQARALENGRFMVRGTNNGITALIDAQGRIVSRLPQFEPGVLRGKAQLMKGDTPYSSYGHYPLLCLAWAILGGMAVARFRHVSTRAIR